MSELSPTDQSPATEKGTYAELPDAELTERIRAGAPSAYPATQELRRRHLPYVLSYARLCGRNQVAGNQLASQAFALAAQEACRGIDPRSTWRHHLLTLVQQVALTWSAGARRDRLDTDFADWIDHAAGISPDRPVPQRLRPEDGSAMLAGFYDLSARTRGVLWYGIVDGEPDSVVASYLGIEPHAVDDLKDKAQEALRQAFLKVYLQRSDDRRCQGFRRIIEAAVRPGDARRSEDLDEHLEECPHCALALAELNLMRGSPRTVLADGLLSWGGAAYVAAGPVSGLSLLESVEAADQDRTGRTEPTDRPVRADGPSRTDRPTRPTRTDRMARTDLMAGPPAVTSLLPRTPGGGPGLSDDDDPAQRRDWWLSPPFLIGAGAALAAALVIALLSGSGEPDPASSSADVTDTPTATVTATRTATSTATATATASAPAPPSPKPTPSPTRSKPAAKKPRPTPTRTAGPPPTRVPGADYAQVVNADSGLCLDIAYGDLENRTDVITAPCSDSATQQWRLDSRGLLHTLADDDFCLDSRGDTDRGVGIWSCSSVDGDNGRNLQFTIDRAGSVRPFIAPDHALTPDHADPGSGLDLDPAEWRADQRWTAGSPPRYERYSQRY